MKYYTIETEEQWDKLMISLKKTKLQEDAKSFRKNMVMGAADV